MQDFLQDIIPHRRPRRPWRTVLYHVLFWLGLAMLLTLFSGRGRGGLSSWPYHLFNLSLYAALVYFNVLVLIPHWLSRHHYWRYLLILFASAFVMTMVKVVSLYSFGLWFPAGDSATEQGYIFLSFLSAGFTSTMIQMAADWFFYQQELREIERKTLSNELRFLRTQINPHFLFNTLNSLYALTLKKSDIAPEIVLKLSEMMRYMLYECNEKTVLLANEIKYMRNYIELERLRRDANIDIRFEVHGEVGNRRIAPLFFMPFLENSFKHGPSRQVKEGFVHVRLDIDDDQVSFAVSNSKPDRMPMGGQVRSGGFGLANVRQRLDLIYPDRHELTISDGPNVYKVHLVIRF